MERPWRSSPNSDGHLLEQKGLFLQGNTPSGWTTTEGVSDRSADWQRILDSGTYPYANFSFGQIDSGNAPLRWEPNTPTPEPPGHLRLRRVAIQQLPTG